MVKVNNPSSLSKAEIDGAIKAATLAVMEAISLPKKDRYQEKVVSRPVALAQLVLAGYSLEQSERALQDVGRIDVESALKSLEREPKFIPPSVTPAVTGSFVPSNLLGDSSQVHAVPANVVANSEARSVAPSFQPGKAPAQPGPAIPSEQTDSAQVMSSLSMFDGAMKLGCFSASSPAQKMRASIVAFEMMVRLLDPVVNQDINVIIRSLQGLSRLVERKKVNANRFVEKGGFRFLMDLLAMQVDHQAVVREGLYLVHLLNKWELGDKINSYPEVRNGSYAVNIISALKKYVSDPAIQEVCASCLWGHVMGVPHLQRLVINLQAVPPMLKAMTLYKGKEAVQQQIVGCLLATAVGNTIVQDKLSALGVKEAIRTTLLHHPGVGFNGQFESLKPWLQADGKASSQLSGAPPHRVSAQSGVSESSQQQTVPRVSVESPQGSFLYSSINREEQELHDLIKIIGENNRNPPIASMARLASLATKGVGGGKEVSAERVMKKGALTEVFTCMRRYLNSPPLQASGCDLLLALVPEIQVGSQDRQECSRMATRCISTGTLAKDSRLVLSASLVLWALATNDPPLQMVMVAEGAVDALMEVSAVHIESQKTSAAIAGALLAIARNNYETQELMLAKGAPKCVKKVLSSHRNINFRGEFDDLKLWLKSSAKPK